MKKFQTLLMCAVMTAALCTGCGNSDEDTTTTATTATEATTVADTTATTEAATTAADTTTTTADFTYATLSNLSFEYSSGAGAWSTEVKINADGSFTGYYHDADMGDAGDDYPNGTMYESTFSGQLSELTKVDDLTYSATVTSISTEKEAGTEEIIDGTKYMYSEPYGMDNAQTIYFYLEGSKTANLPAEFVSWVNTALTLSDGSTSDTLTFIGLYNENAQEGFSSY